VVVGGVAMAMSVASMAHWAHNKTLLDLSSIQADLQWDCFRNSKGRR